MAFGFGTGFLPDPYSQKRPKGGSIKASQDKDTSVIITGDPASGGIGFASPSAFGGKLQRSNSSPESTIYQPKTAAEIKERGESRGLAETHQNMGSLAVGFRASEQAKKDAGEQTVRGARAAKVLDQRAAAARIKYESQTGGRGREAYIGATGRFLANTKTYRSSSLGGLLQRSNRGAGGGLLSKGKRTAGGGSTVASTSKAKQSKASNNLMGPDHSMFLTQYNKDRGAVDANRDLMALAAQRALT